MPQSKKLSVIIKAMIFALGIIGTALTRNAAISDGASSFQTLLFALFVIAAVLGAVSLLSEIAPKHRETNVRTLVFSAMFAALCYIGFAYLKIDIPVGSSSTAFHLGNVFVVLAALFLGGYWGGLSGAVGLSIADLTTQYVTSAPKTFLLKFCIGLISGIVAHKVFQLNKNQERKIPLPIATVLSCAAGMGFNVIADPIVGYFYKQYLLGVPQDAAKLLAKMGAIYTLVNAVIAVIVASILYLALRAPMNRIGGFNKD